MKLTRQLKGDNWRQSHGFCFHSVKKVSVVLMEQEKKMNEPGITVAFFVTLTYNHTKAIRDTLYAIKNGFDKVIITDFTDNFVSLGI